MSALLAIALAATVLLPGSRGVAHAQDLEYAYAEHGEAPVFSFGVADAEGTVAAWSLTGIDGGDFAIDDGVLSFKRPPDYEIPTDAGGDNVYKVTVNVTDGISTTSLNVTVTVTNVDEVGAVVLSSLQPEVDIPLSATLADPDGAIEDVTWSWEISGDAAGEWTPIGGDPSDTYTPVEDDIGRHLRVIASYADGEGGGKRAQVPSDNVVREPHHGGHAPRFPAGETGIRSVPENTGAGTPIGAPLAAGDDEDHVLTYTLGGAEAAAFDIVRSSGQLLTRAYLDYESKSSYTVTLTVSDPTNAYDTVTVTVTVTNVEEEGTLTLSTPQPHVDEALLAYLDDPDEDVSDITWVWERSPDRITWTAISGAGSATYTPVDADDDSYLRVTATYTDAEGSGKSARTASLNTVHELETNHGPTFLPTETGIRRVAENTPPGTDIGEPFTALDDHDHALTYSLGGEDAEFFEIDELTGQVRTKAPLDYESRVVYAVTVAVQDNEDAYGDPDLTNDATLAAAIVVADVDLGPYDLNGDEAIEEVEALLAVADYLTGQITREEALRVLRLYLGLDSPGPAATDRVDEPAPAPAPALGTCCEVRGMSDAPDVQAAVVEEMRSIIQFGRENYGLGHSGPITINVSHSPNGLFVRYRDAFGHTPQTLPDDCSFQEGEHLFFGPGCRHDKRALATEWFRRAVGAGETDPPWIGLGAAEYFATHYAQEEAPTLEQERFQRVVFRSHPLELRRNRAELDQMTMAVVYAVDTHGTFEEWIAFQRQVLAGRDADVAFEEVFGASLEEFHHLFEEWSEHENIILIAAAFDSCHEAWQSVGLLEGRPRFPMANVGFPEFRVPLARDRDDDGIVCEG